MQRNRSKIQKFRKSCSGKTEKSINQFKKASCIFPLSAVCVFEGWRMSRFSFPSCLCELCSTTIPIRIRPFRARMLRWPLRGVTSSRLSAWKMTPGGRPATSRIATAEPGSSPRRSCRKGLYSVFEWLEFKNKTLRACLPYPAFILPPFTRLSTEELLYSDPEPCSSLGGSNHQVISQFNP